VSEAQLESGNNSGCDSGDRISGHRGISCPESEPEFVQNSDKQIANELSDPITDGCSETAFAALSEQDSAAVRNYCANRSISAESLLRHCWSELVRAYSGSRELADKLARTIIVARGRMQSGVVFSGNGRSPLLFLEVLNAPAIELCASFKAGSLEPKLVDVLLECLLHLVKQVPSSGDGPLSKLELVPPSLGTELLDSGTKSGWTSPLRCVHQLIAEQSWRFPQRIAATVEQDEVTYGALNSEANRLARYLVTQGIGSGSIVAVHLPRSAGLLTTLLAVLKAGAAFLPLDLSLPKERVTGIVDDAQAVMVLTCSRRVHAFWNTTARVVCLDSEGSAWQDESELELEDRAGLNDLAYVTYTSGSTGKPKGVMIEHGHLAASFAGMDKVLGVESGVWLSSANISFDIALTELLWTLVHGFHIVFHQGDEGAPILSGPHSVVAQMKQHGVSHLQGTPTLIRMLMSDPSAPEAFSRLEKLLVGGEPFPPGLADALEQLITTGDVFNVYGPTETTICATYHPVAHAQNPVPIGKPTRNTRAYVLDSAGRQLPPLAPGELYLGGDAVGRGYLGRPDLTAERFLPDPFSEDSKGRMYRTGDLVCWLLDGTLEFLDRLDSQVKIRGFRIELGEIEAALRAHPAVAEAAVVVRGEASGEKTLAGFFQVRPDLDVTGDDLVSHLRRVLPAYMVPASLIRVEGFSVTPNGKLDRAKLQNLIVGRSLPESSSSGEHRFEVVQVSAEQDPELREIEAALRGWCGELLGLLEVEPTADFFAIGGQSLVAAQLVQRIGKKYGVHLRLSAFIKARTLRDLAEMVNQSQQNQGSNRSDDEQWSPVVAVRSRGEKTPIFLVAGLGGNVVNFELLSRSLNDDRPVYAVETRGINRQQEVLTTIEDMARTYLQEVQRVQPQGPYHLCGYSFGGVIVFEMAHQLRAAGHQVGLIGMIDTPEWHYTQRVWRSFGPFERMQILYGGAVRRIVFGPNRLGALAARVRLLGENCRIVLSRIRGRQLDESFLRPEHRNYQALTRYVPRYFPGDIHLFRCPDRARPRGTDPLLGWGKLAQRSLVSVIPGQHGILTTEPFVGFLGEALRRSLDSLESTSASREASHSAISVSPRLLRTHA
jgi:amino acid adenylation domain-containing protein